MIVGKCKLSIILSLIVQAVLLVSAQAWALDIPSPGASRAKAEAEMHAKAELEAKMKTKLEADAKARAEAEIKAKSEASSLAKTADTGAKSRAEVQTKGGLALGAGTRSEMHAKPAGDAQLSDKVKPNIKIDGAKIYDGAWRMVMICGINLQSSRPGYTFKKEVQIANHSFYDEVTNKNQLGVAHEKWTGHITGNTLTISVVGSRDNGDQWDVRFSGRATSSARIDASGVMTSKLVGKIRDCKLELTRA
ncbi:MAG: hypothetical protein RLZZ591_1929 [Pseudomonadota bacterium]|jgi:hypothetical protein